MAIKAGRVGVRNDQVDAYGRIIGGEGTGTVTRVATGTGLTGGPITTTGTIAVDTSVIATVDALDDYVAIEDAPGYDDILTQTDAATDYQGKLTAGANITISDDNVISATGELASAAWGQITGTLADQTDLATALGGKQATLTAGTNISIVDNVISATGGGTGTVTSVVAGTGLTGGTITSTGTIAVDTDVIATVDSLDDYVVKDDAPGYDDILTQTEAEATYTTQTSFDELAEEVDTKQAAITSDNKLAANLVSGLANVATTGAYSDLSGTPDLSGYATNTALQQGLATKITSGAISASESGTSTNEVGYLTIEGNEYKLAGGGGGSYTKTLLWTNSDSTASFPSTSLTFSDLNDYDELLIFYKPYSNYTEFQSTSVVIRKNTKYSECITDMGVFREGAFRYIIRKYSFNTETKQLDIQNCNTFTATTSQTSTNEHMIPLSIYSIKY